MALLDFSSERLLLVLRYYARSVPKDAYLCCSTRAQQILLQLNPAGLQKEQSARHGLQNNPVHG
jgi:hypothetical protein